MGTPTSIAWILIKIFLQASLSRYFFLTKMNMLNMSKHHYDNSIKQRSCPVFSLIFIQNSIELICVWASDMIDLGYCFFLAHHISVYADGRATFWKSTTIWILWNNWTVKRSFCSIFQPADLSNCCFRIRSLEWRSNIQMHSVFLSGEAPLTTEFIFLHF